MRLLPHLLLLPLAVASVQVAFAQDTAYQALRTLGSNRDQALLNRIVEVKGRSGAPQPSTWLIVIDDPKARGGVREVEISGGRIASERTPVQAYSGSAGGAIMDMSRLNLDSQGAFAVAEDEAKAAGVAFDTVDYVLRRGDDGSAPIWVLQLIDRNEHGVGTVRISADNGSVASRQFRSGGSRSAASEAPSARSSARSSTPPPPARAEERSDYTYRDEAPSSARQSTSGSGRNGTRHGRPATRGNVPRSSVESSTTYRSDSRSDYRAPVRGRDIEGSYEEAPRERTNVYDRDPSKRRDVGYRVNRRVHRIGGALQEFFTGRRTVDDDYREPYDYE